MGAQPQWSRGSLGLGSGIQHTAFSVERDGVRVGGREVGDLDAVMDQGGFLEEVT